MVSLRQFSSHLKVLRFKNISFAHFMHTFPLPRIKHPSISSPSMEINGNRISLSKFFPPVQSYITASFLIKIIICPFSSRLLRPSLIPVTVRIVYPSIAIDYYTVHFSPYIIPSVVNPMTSEHVGEVFRNRRF